MQFLFKDVDHLLTNACRHNFRKDTRARTYSFSDLQCLRRCLAVYTESGITIRFIVYCHDREGVLELLEYMSSKVINKPIQYDWALL